MELPDFETAPADSSGVYFTPPILPQPGENVVGAPPGSVVDPFSPPAPEPEKKRHILGPLLAAGAVIVLFTLST